MSKTILGLDLGTNSIGWAILKFEDDECKQLSEIVKAGSRIIPSDDDIKNFEQGKAAVKNADRRQKRGARRNNQRFKARRDNLIQVGKLLNVLPNDFEITRGISNTSKETQFDEILLGKTYTAKELYTLHVKGLSERIELNELFKLLIHFNSRRGYKSNRKERKELLKFKQQKDTSNFTTIEDILIVSAKETGEIKNKKKEYQVFAIRPDKSEITFQSNYALLPKLINKEISAEFNFRTLKDGTQTISAKFNSDDSWKGKVFSLNRALNKEQKHPSEYWLEQIQSQESRDTNEDFRVKDRIIMRDKYISEFNQLWKTQLQYHPILSDSNLFNSIVNAICPNHYPEKEFWKKRNLHEFVRDFIIYYQRPLKNQKFLIKKCNYETQRRVTPRSNPIFQYFRSIQEVRNYNILESVDSYKKVNLTLEQSKCLLEALILKGELKKKEVAKILNVEEERLPNRDKIKGCTSFAELNKLSNSRIDQYSLQQQVDLWHLIYSSDNIEEEKLIQNLTKKFPELSKLEEYQLEEIAALNFEEDYAEISEKAIKKILPLIDINQESLDSIYWKAIQDLKDGVENDLIANGAREIFYNNPNTFQISNEYPFLHPSDAFTLMYGKTGRLDSKEPFNNWSDIKPISQKELRNPAVTKLVNETLLVVKDIWKTYGKPDAIHVETTREIKQSQEQRSKADSIRRKREKEREDAKKAIIDTPEFGVRKPKRKDIERYLLWKSQSWTCPYSGSKIQKADVFSGNTDIDHIIPRTRFFDDSFANKVLCFRSENGKKDNQTAFEYMKAKGEAEWNRFENWVVETFNGRVNKRKKEYCLTDTIPDGFTNRDLTATSYISKRIKTELERITDIVLVSGKLTDELRRQWEIDSVFKRLVLDRYFRFEALHDLQLVDQDAIKPYAYEPQLEGYSKRIDHRHHAMDAIVVACATRSRIQHFNTLNARSVKNEFEKTARKIRYSEKPNNQIQKLVFEALDSIIVSHKFTDRLIGATSNRYKKRDSNGKLVVTEQLKGLSAVQGALHKETVYGKIKRYDKLDIAKLLKDYSTYKHLIVHSWQAEIITQYLLEYGGVEKARKHLKKLPLMQPNGNILSHITVWQEIPTKTITLNDSITEEQIAKIVHGNVKSVLNSHKAKFNSLKEAFSEENIASMNQNLHKPIKSVTIENQGSFETISDEQFKYFKYGNNYCVIVNKNGFRCISFFEAVVTKLNDLELFNEKNCQVLKKGFIVEVESTLYINKELNDTQIYFLPINVSGFIELKGKKEFGSKDKTEFMDFPPFDSKKNRIKIIKSFTNVKITRLGLKNHEKVNLH